MSLHSQSSGVREILTGNHLGANLPQDIGVDTSIHDWVTADPAGYFRLVYPASQDWGVMFVFENRSRPRERIAPEWMARPIPT